MRTWEFWNFRRSSDHIHMGKNLNYFLISSHLLNDCCVFLIFLRSAVYCSNLHLETEKRHHTTALGDLPVFNIPTTLSRSFTWNLCAFLNLSLIFKSHLNLHILTLLPFEINCELH